MIKAVVPQVVFMAAVLWVCGCMAHTHVYPDMPTLIREWRIADGAGVLDTEEKLFNALLANPNAFYQTMSTDTISFDRFVDKLQVGLFTEFGDKPLSRLEKKREAALSQLENADIEQAYLPLHEKVLGTLKTIRAQGTE